MYNRTRPLILCLCLTISACFSTPKAIDMESAKKQLAYIQNGEINKDAVIKRLGTPSSQLENGRIVIYRFQIDPKGNIIVLHEGRFEMILVFDDKGALRRHGLSENKRAQPVVNEYGPFDNPPP